MFVFFCFFNATFSKISVVSQTKTLFTQTLISRIPFSLFLTDFLVWNERMQKSDHFEVKVELSSFPCFKLNFMFASIKFDFV